MLVNFFKKNIVITKEDVNNAIDFFIHTKSTNKTLELVSMTDNQVYFQVYPMTQRGSWHTSYLFDSSEGNLILLNLHKSRKEIINKFDNSKYRDEFIHYPEVHKQYYRKTILDVQDLKNYLYGIIHDLYSKVPNVDLIINDWS